MSGSAYAILSTPNNWPGCAAYFQQRKTYAASYPDPDTFWMTQPGNYHNMNVSLPSKDSDAITGTIVSKELNAIRHLVEMNNGLLALTSSGAWLISGGTPGADVTPATITAQPQSFVGCSNVRPLVIGYDVMFIQDRGSIVRSMSYQFYLNIYTGNDISTLSSHLFFGHSIVDWDYAEEPFKIIWAVRSDGVLLSLTYVKEQEVYGWARHDTQGLVESVCTVVEGGENIAYVVVRRFIPVIGWQRYIERMASRYMGADPSQGAPADIEKAWCLDAALSLPLTYRQGVLNVFEIPIAGGTQVGQSVTVYAQPTDGVSAMFFPGDVGQIIRSGGGKMTVTAYLSPQSAQVTITRAITRLTQNQYNPGYALAQPVQAGGWSIAPVVSSVSGLGHLEGMTVGIIADGVVMLPQVVRGGSVSFFGSAPGGSANIAQTASSAIVGLGYQCQMQTLRLDTGEPTSQGKRKKVAAVTVRVQDSRGIKVGNTFGTLVSFKDRSAYLALGAQNPLYTGDERIVLDPKWGVEGQVCIQIDDPVPATILGIIPEIVVGDT
jgi:hypothetical protein